MRGVPPNIKFVENAPTIKINKDIPRSRHDPKILWVDDAEIVGDRITKVRPIPRNLFTQKTERRIGELGTSCVALVGRNGFAEASWVKAGVTWLEVSLGLAGVVLPRRDIQPRETTMSPLRARMIEDMILAGLAEGTRQSYVRAVRQLTAFYRRAPDQLSEEEVRRYLLGLRQRGVARGTFQIARYGLQFFYCHTLGRVWELFGEKKDRLAAAEAAA